MPHSIQLLLLCWLVLFGIFQEVSLRAGISSSHRDTFLLATTAWASTLVLITEGLSLFKLLQRDALLTAWLGVLLAGTAVYGYLLWQRTKFNFSFLPLSNSGIKPPSLLTFTLIVLIAFQVVTLAIVAYHFAPNNWDSMTYHLARGMHWQQNQSVGHYATSIERQIQMPPFAEFVIVQLRILLQGDQYANLVQWSAMLVCVIGVSDIARKLGANPEEQITALSLCASIPMGILQATSTQNDYVVSAWLVCFVSFGLSLIKDPRRWLWAMCTGLALGLALLTKSTAFVFAAPFCLWFGVILLIRLRWHAFRIGTVIAITVVAINMGHFTRNTLLYGSPLGPTTRYRNEELSLRVLFSNLIRNTAIHVPDDNTRIGLVNTTSRYVSDGLRRLHELTGLSPTDPRASWTLHKDVFANPLGASLDEDYAGNTVHTLLIVLAIPIGLLTLRDKRAKRYMIALVLAFCLFSFYLKWQVWGSRLQLPLFVLWCSILAIVLFPHGTKLRSFAPIIVVFLSLLWTFGNHTRPIYSIGSQSATRTDGYFTRRPELRIPYQTIADTVVESECSSIGLVLGEDSWEYPIWMLLQERGYQGTINHIQVDTPSSIYSPPDLCPCAVISEDKIHGYESFLELTIDHFFLYLKPFTHHPASR